MGQDQSRTVTPSAVRGRGIGIIVCAVFAALWTNWASPLLSRLPEPYGWVSAFVAVAASGTLLIAGAAMVLRARRLSRATGMGDAAPRAMRRGFVVVLVGEIVAFNVAAYLLASHHAMQYLPPAIAVVVGLHFLPLAKIFRAPPLFGTAVVMTLAGALAAVAIATGGSATVANGVAELACAIALWGTGYLSWFLVHRALARNQGQSELSGGSPVAASDTFGRPA